MFDVHLSTILMYIKRTFRYTSNKIYLLIDILLFLYNLPTVLILSSIRIALNISAKKIVFIMQVHVIFCFYTYSSRHLLINRFI
jgi:hypothetical protein